MLNYTPRNWHWIASDGRIFSSVRQALVQSDNADYAAWSEKNAPTIWPRDALDQQTDASLAEVLAPYEIFVGFDALKQSMKLAIDAEAEIERPKYITPGDGQAMTYQQKVAEAQAFRAASNPQASDYPILSSEVGITADTLAEVTEIVLAAFAQWQQIGAMIEAIRLGAKRDIDAADDAATTRAIVDAIVWPSSA
ncbi:hypothetical protein [Ochrobactrum quorumnocens]|uniref:DUF4376 domain-containing protein n=1 Tax=Ochrobactrum quorumnocens TaxID=271865 RepID=A0A5N1K3E5_9HYPH|nr:hypothetical protein [[Ochrobactrum] quorumnocens]KAA9370917.1 hypothetical protein F3W84_00400 [[Ochrobactrum] quorumnocens]